MHLFLQIRDIKIYQNLILDKYFGIGLKDKLQRNMSLVEEASQPFDQISIREVSFDALLEENNKLLFIDDIKGQYDDISTISKSVIAISKDVINNLPTYLLIIKVVIGVLGLGIFVLIFFKFITV